MKLFSIKSQIHKFNTAKEFAEKMFNKFMELHPYDENSQNKGLGESKEISKKCAIIAVENIVIALKNTEFPTFMRTYYDNVIFEIEEL